MRKWKPTKQGEVLPQGHTAGRWRQAAGGGRGEWGVGVSGMSVPPLWPVSSGREDTGAHSFGPPVLVRGLRDVFSVRGAWVALT